MKYASFLFLLCATAQAADREFTDVVHAISVEFRTRPMHIPLFGLVNAFTFFVRPAGTRHIDLAVFENLDSRGRAGNDLTASIRAAVGGSWKPFIQVRSSKRGSEETVLVYMRPHGRDCKLLVATVERNEATVVQLELNPEALQRWIDSPGESGKTIFSKR
jgi:hypothetical protein